MARESSLRVGCLLLYEPDEVLYDDYRIDGRQRGQSYAIEKRNHIER